MEKEGTSNRGRASSPKEGHLGDACARHKIEELVPHESIVHWSGGQEAPDLAMLRQFLQILAAAQQAKLYEIELPTQSSEHGLISRYGSVWHRTTLLLAAYKVFWLSVPLEAIESDIIDVRPLGRRMALSLLGTDSEEDVALVTALLKRIRRYHLYGRSRSDRLRRRYLESLLQRQKGRCITCGYFFSEVEINAAEYVSEEAAERQIEGLRVPHIDHVIPVFLGGEDPANLQLLCSQCNQAKGVAISWAVHPSILGPRQPTHLRSATMGERWTVLARDERCLICGLDPLRAPNRTEIAASAA